MAAKRWLVSLVALFIGITVFAKDEWLLVGTYTNAGSYGIYVFRFDPETAISVLVDSVACENPSYLCLSPNGKFVYSITENGGTKPGEVSAYRFDRKTGHLTYINEVSSGGDHPCYVSIDKTGRWVAVANYTGGSLSILPVSKNGSLEAAAQTIKHVGSGPLLARQKSPHVHSTIFSPKEDYLLAADLGTDKVVAYPFNAKKSKPLEVANAINIETGEATGPRHFTFHPIKPILYIIEELTGSVAVFEKKENLWQQIQSVISDTVSALPDRGSADIHASPDGKFLYTSNRGTANYLSIYAIDQSTGRLKMVGSQSVLGATPRNFTLDVTGKYLLAANQNSNNIVCFKRNAGNGLLELAGNILDVSKPVCLKMINAAD